MDLVLAVNYSVLMEVLDTGDELMEVYLCFCLSESFFLLQQLFQCLEKINKTIIYKVTVNDKSCLIFSTYCHKIDKKIVKDKVLPGSSRVPTRYKHFLYPQKHVRIVQYEDDEVTYEFGFPIVARIYLSIQTSMQSTFC